MEIDLLKVDVDVVVSKTETGNNKVAFDENKNDSVPGIQIAADDSSSEMSQNASADSGNESTDHEEDATNNILANRLRARTPGLGLGSRVHPGQPAQRKSVAMNMRATNSKTSDLAIQNLNSIEEISNQLSENQDTINATKDRCDDLNGEIQVMDQSLKIAEEQNSDLKFQMDYLKKMLRQAKLKDSATTIGQVLKEPTQTKISKKTTPNHSKPTTPRNLQTSNNKPMTLEVVDGVSGPRTSPRSRSRTDNSKLSARNSAVDNSRTNLNSRNLNAAESVVMNSSRISVSRNERGRNKGPGKGSRSRK